MTNNGLNAVVTQKIEVAPGLFILQVVPDGWQLPPFRAGQFAVLGLPPEAPRHPMADPADDAPSKPGVLIRRSYSIASSAADQQYLEFYLNLVRSGSLTPRLCALEVGDRLWLGPRISGLFTFDQLPDGVNLVMVATGTGLAPYMSMLRTDLEHEKSRRLAVLHSARHSWDLGYRAELIMMERLRRNLTYIATVSRPDEEPIPWGGHVGRVQELWRGRILEGIWGFHPEPTNTHVFLSGNPDMIDEMTAMLASEGFREHTPQKPGELHVEKYW
jgi:ferredoxin--NADP+ reductase